MSLLSMPIHILHVITSLTSGGAERQLVNLVRNTDADAFKHTVCHLRPANFFAAELEEAGHEVINLNLAAKYPWPSAARRLAALIRERRPQLIHTRLFDANLSTRLALTVAPRTPVITSIESPDYEPETIRATGWPPAKVEILRRVDKVTGRWSNPVFIACSRYVERSAREHLGIAAARIRVIYNSIDPNTLSSEVSEAAGLKASLGIPADGFVYINVGRLDPPKGHAYLLHAFREIATTQTNAHLVVVGDGPSANDLRRLARELSIDTRTHFLGRRKDVGACLAMADVFVFPTLLEGHPLALVEAMLKGVACVASRIEPMLEVLTDGVDGLLVEPTSVAGFAAAMHALYGDRERRERLAARAQENVRARFLSSVIVPQWETLYRETARIVKARGGRIT